MTSFRPSDFGATDLPWILAAFGLITGLALAIDWLAKLVSYEPRLFLAGLAAGWLLSACLSAWGERRMRRPLGGPLSEGVKEQVTGVDLSSTCLGMARDLAKRRGLTVTWEHRDMSDLPWERAFDGAFTMGNSLGYADDDHDARFLEAIAGALKPGGRFVLDYPCVTEALLPAYQERTWYPVGDTLFLREGHYNHVAGRIETVYTVIRGSDVEKKPWTQRVYTYREICRLVAESGFTDLQSYAALTREPFKLRSQGLLLVATKAH